MPRANPRPSRPSGGAPARGVIIVESPNKAKTIRAIVGSDWDVVATVGHFCDLPERELGVDVANGFRPTYVYASDKQQVVAQLRAIKSRYASGNIVVASDADREGEAIGWHVARTIGLRPEEVRRAEFHEITEAGVRRAMAQLRPLDLGLVAAQEARRILDRLVGYTVSPVVRDRLPTERDLSAGRVQSVALRVVVDRELAIRAFTPTEFWRIHARYPWPGSERGGEATRRRWSAEVVGTGGPQRPRELPLPNEAAARAVVAAIEGVPHHVARLVRREARRQPPAPFVTATMLARASVRLRMGTDETTRHAKTLFEAGLVTYIRTDDPSVAPDFQRETLDWLRARHGDGIVPARPNKHKARAAAKSQGAHECIRPTRLEDPRADGLDGRTRALYDLIRETYLASQCAPARYDVTEAWLTAVRPEGDPVVLKAVGRILRDPGFLAIFGQSADDEEEEEGERAPLPPLAEGDAHTPAAIEPSQHWTRPPERFTEATLIKYLEARGIGRPSTFNAMVAKIRQRAYVETVDRRFLRPTPKGEVLDAELRAFFSPVIKEGFTSELETRLDAIAAREENWRTFMAGFWAELTPLLDAARRAPRTARSPGGDARAAQDPTPPSRRDPAAAAPRRSRRKAPPAGVDAPAAPARRRRQAAAAEAPQSQPPPCPRCQDAFTRRIVSARDGRAYLVCGRDTPEQRVCGFIMAEADAANPACPACGAPTRRVPGKGFGCTRWRREGGPESCSGWIKEPPPRRGRGRG